MCRRSKPKEQSSNAEQIGNYSAQKNSVLDDDLPVFSGVGSTETVIFYVDAYIQS